jgi:hypothetical protein
MSYFIRKNKSIQLFVVLVFLTILKRSHCSSVYNKDLNEKMSSEELVLLLITVIFIVLFIFILILE